MRSLYGILEGLLDDDTQVKLGFSDVDTKANYALFLEYVGDLLYKRSPYQYFPSLGQISFLLKDQNSEIDKVYYECNKALNNYFFKLKSIYRSKRLYWTKSSKLGSMVYFLNIREEKQPIGIIFKVVNRHTGKINQRIIKIFFPNDYKFMTPE